MKKPLFLVLALCLALSGMAQNCYWVFLTDKAGTGFDPYAYFDAKAIERYRQNHADLYDLSNYPLNARYVQQVETLATEPVGASRWLNAVAVMATPAQMNDIAALPCVRDTRMIASDMQMAACRADAHRAAPRQAALESRRMASLEEGAMPGLTEQLLRMQGNLFQDKNVNGDGIRVAVFDGGFPRVNTHDAFKHLRDNKQIIATWNFCDKKADVYGWNTHGTMVLSCIAGILHGKQLGLATGATFLLARTEVEPEPYKEEVWWMQAMEWADKNGADVINSSLGYGKDRHYTYEMDGRSTVAHAANMAARKGMLVCNSAGNEGDDKSWKTIITPADADSILTVGGISATLEQYQHIDFSSYGPTADGRMKPNVCNFGQADVADPGNDTAMESVFGTSFSSPLTAGFCACAWQTRRGFTAMQMKAEVEKSADLYPYFDYAFGYGVPQASYFVNHRKEQAAEPTFGIEEQGQYILLKATGKRMETAGFKDEQGKAVKREDALFVKVTDATGKVIRYYDFGFDSFDGSHNLMVHKSGLVDRTLTAFFDGCVQDYRLTPADNEAMRTFCAESNIDTNTLYYAEVDSNGAVIEGGGKQYVARDLSDNAIRALGDKWFLEGFVGLGMPVHAAAAEQDIRFALPLSSIVEFNAQYAFKRCYRLGLGMFLAGNNFVLPTKERNMLDPQDITAAGYDVDKKTVDYGEWGLEFFQRVRLFPGGSLFHNGFFWDLGVYGSRGWNRYDRDLSRAADGQELNMQLHGLAPLDDYQWNWGLNTRLVNDWYGIYLRYRLNGIGQDAPQGSMLLPRLQVGLMLNF